MDTRLLLGLFALGAAAISGGVLFYYLLFPRRATNMRSLMGSGQRLGSPREERERMMQDETGEAYERLKKATRKATKKKVKLTIDEKFYQAGIFSPRDKREFARMRLLVPVFTTPLAGFITSQFAGVDMVILGMVMGLLLGLQIPYSRLDRMIKRRNEEILYYLPLVIEQIAIGVSSSLDVGPCLQRVVSMADERDTHNVVSELLRHAQNHVKSGVSLEEALMEVGRRSGHNELKHAFMSLSQVSKHGGEITRQLQELADAVAGQRETKIEEIIKKLELKATGPVALVFVGFLTIFLIGFGVQIKDAFG